MSQVQRIDSGSNDPIYRFRAEFEGFCVFYQSPRLQSHVEFKCDAVEAPFGFSPSNKRCEVKINQTAFNLIEMVTGWKDSCVNLDKSKMILRGNNMVIKNSGWSAACDTIAKWFDFQRINGPDQ